MRFKLSRFRLAVFGLATMSAFVAIFASPFPGMNPLSQFVGGQSVSRCPPRPTPLASAAPPMTIAPPTTAPTATPGPPPHEAKPDPTLVHPLKSKKQVLRRVYEIDRYITSWAEPWCLPTLKLEPDRIKIESYPSQYAYIRLKQPPAYHDPGPIWVVTIKGEVYYSVPCSACATAPHAYGLRYTIAKSTGMLASISGLSQQEK